MGSVKRWGKRGNAGPSTAHLRCSAQDDTEKGKKVPPPAGTCTIDDGDCHNQSADWFRNDTGNGIDSLPYGASVSR